MTLIKCADCGKDISDKAVACIHCGCPIERKVTIESDKKNVVSKETEYKFCTDCGAKMKVTDKKCKKCEELCKEKVKRGIEDDDSKKFCIKCGTAIKSDNVICDDCMMGEMLYIKNLTI